MLLPSRQINPRHQTVNKQTERVLVHIEWLSLRSGLLIVLDVVQIYPLDAVAEIVLVYASVTR